jgi:hypothetical protein
MVTGRDLIENGWPEGPTIGLALAAARKLRAAGIIHRSAWNRNSRKFVSSISHTRGRTGRKGGREALTWCIQGM